MIKHDYVICKKCNHKHLKQALYCPNCIKANPKDEAIIGYGMLIILLIGVVWGSSSLFFDQEEAPPKSRNLAELEIEALSRFNRNIRETNANTFSENVIGRWCDRMIPNQPEYNYVITISGINGKYSITSLFSDGTSLTNDLKGTSVLSFEVIGNSRGEKYKISSNSGNLQLLDADGLIRTAEKLNTVSRSGEC